MPGAQGPSAQPAPVEHPNPAKARVALQHPSSPGWTSASTATVRPAAAQRGGQRRGEQRLAQTVVDPHQQHPAGAGRREQCRTAQEQRRHAGQGTLGEPFQSLGPRFHGR